MLIAISQGIGHIKYEKYAPWIQSLDSAVKTIELSGLEPAEALERMNEVDGIIFTGGGDIHPRRYCETEDDTGCQYIDEERDERELAWIAITQNRRIPVLAICRGMQLMNVVLGGTLHKDIPSIHPSALPHSINDTEDASHPIEIVEGSLLAHIQGSTSGQTNSSHHQSLDRIGHGLRITAQAPDGMVEGVEWSEPGDYSFFLGVQWHPERMDVSNPMSGGVGRAFIEAMKK